MKVQMCETVTVDVETMVHVDISDILMEFSRRMESAEINGDMPVKSVFLPLVDFATRMMARIPVEGIQKCQNSQRVTVAQRLLAEAERWKTDSGEGKR